MFNFAIKNYYNLNCNINWGAIFRKYFKTDKKISEAGQISKVCDGITKKYIYISLIEKQIIFEKLIKITHTPIQSIEICF